MGKGGNQQPAISASEHIAKEDGENIDAKRVGNYVWNGIEWERQNSTMATSAKQDLSLTELQTLNSLTPSIYDYISLSYTGDNLTGVIFKMGGSGGTTVSTLTLAYSGAVLTSVTKT